MNISDGLGTHTVGNGACSIDLASSLTGNFRLAVTMKEPVTGSISTSPLKEE